MIVIVLMILAWFTIAGIVAHHAHVNFGSGILPEPREDQR